eukprot:CAMPEP_0182436184 /NCGR_PEP_ID=MMETSP1167-20130531/80142_1 /TAXON_ID=2988 /ORGANISM="Mallomonas Sp, Strain CCMP3275" /LENGTH=120 /DNA_ID=CAMNT_0024628059 /DNA_START=114 /DNA_END=472 /DNA_ORIENTATION=-
MSEKGTEKEETLTPTSALYYDPFAARAQRDREKSVLCEVLWPAKESCIVIAAMRNPLTVALRISHVKVLYEGVRCHVTPVSVTLPPGDTTAYIRLNILPTSPGILRITGISYQVHNACYR